jgi:hypothetical protein
MTPLQQIYLDYHRHCIATGQKPIGLSYYYDAVFGQEAIETYFRK